jgi:hypothetical protein
MRRASGISSEKKVGGFPFNECRTPNMEVKKRGEHHAVVSLMTPLYAKFLN